MKKIILIFCGLFTFYSCVKPVDSNSDISDYIPKNSQIIFKGSNYNSFINDLKNNHYFKSQQLTKDLINALDFTDRIKVEEDFLICVTKTESIPNFTFITKASNPSFYVTSKTDERAYVKDSIYIHIGEQEVVDTVAKVTKSELYNKHYIPSDSTSFILFFESNKIKLNNKNKAPFTHALEDIPLEFYLTPKTVAFNGYRTNRILDSVVNFTMSTNTAKLTSPTVVPNNANAYEVYAYSAIDMNKNYSDRLGHPKNQSQLANDLLSTIEEIGQYQSEKGTAVVLKSFDIKASQEALLPYTSQHKKLRSIEVYKLDCGAQEFPLLPSPLKQVTSTKNYVVLDDCIVFSENENILADFIIDYLREVNLTTNEIYKEINKHLSTQMSWQYTGPTTFLDGMLQSVYQDNSNKKQNKAKVQSAIQFIADEERIHINASLQPKDTLIQKRGVKEIFNLVLDNEIISTPQLVTNHLTKEKEIVVQDVDFNLYLISSTGRVLWKKNINRPIIGDIKQIDSYKNGRLQLAFCTEDKLYVIDRKGNNVGAFPLKFKDRITQGLAVFDYDKNKNYRLLVIQDTEILMYDQRGKRIKGFNYKAKESILTVPKHFRIAAKDYIVFPTADKLKIINRRGKTRVKPKSKITFSNNEVFLYQSKFTTTDANGNLVQVATNGDVKKEPLKLPEKHYMTSTTKTLVILSDNKLKIKSKSLDLEYGSYSRPEIFYFNDIIYVALTNLETQRAFLLDSKGNILDGFPVFGSSTLQMNNIDKDRGLEFVLKGDPNSLLMYELN